MTRTLRQLSQSIIKVNVIEESIYEDIDQFINCSVDIKLTITPPYLVRRTYLTVENTGVAVLYATSIWNKDVYDKIIGESDRPIGEILARVCGPIIGVGRVKADLEKQKYIKTDGSVSFRGRYLADNGGAIFCYLEEFFGIEVDTVSYTHLTLPTIYSV
eukprot:TRINITY_DN10392_c0_g1_i2.p1 TRINITY_DN10392_c0_g1~~TRINITY_DN10392_c0_g1_i2.p1  ORF type:complete len:159 (-),score=5.20 TRINITY_DN10392_c0_g1_i2:34-510(-)